MHEAAKQHSVFRDPRVICCVRNKGAHGEEVGNMGRDVKRIQLMKKRSLDLSLRELGA